MSEPVIFMSTKKNILNTSPKRMWINQPSTNQQFHKYNGCNVITIPPVMQYEMPEAYILIYFAKGEVISMFIPISVLSEGWIGEY